MQVLVIDNYDSFTYNLVHRIRETGEVESVIVQRNDEVSAAVIRQADAIVCSPGPGIPEEAGELLTLIRQYGPQTPLLGVCLGMQAIAQVYGGDLRNLNQVYHGVATTLQVIDQSEALFSGLPELFEAGRYHSWVIDGDSLPEDVKVTVIDESGEIMAIRHRQHPVVGLQFHPESILTPSGQQILSNFISSAAAYVQAA